MKWRRRVWEWSVVAIGVGLLLVSLGYFVLDEGSVLEEVAEVSLPVACAVGIVAFGRWLQRRWDDPWDVGFVALMHLSGGVVLALVTGWLLFVTEMETGLPPDVFYVFLNGAAIGTLASGILGALYLRLVRQQADLRDLNAELRQQNDRLDEFAAAVSHDLRSPLSVARGRLELARESGDPEEFDALADAHDRIEEIISDILSLARGGSVEDLEAVSLEAVARRAMETTDVDGVELDVEGDRRLAADPGQLRQLLENLFCNAADHGGSDVSEVRVGPLEDGFYVEDDGVGIPSEERDNVFETGYTTASDGTGFGLTIVEEVSEAHGWAVAASEGAGGARFEVTGVETAPERANAPEP